MEVILTLIKDAMITRHYFFNHNFYYLKGSNE